MLLYFPSRTRRTTLISGTARVPRAPSEIPARKVAEWRGNWLDRFEIKGTAQTAIFHSQPERCRDKLELLLAKTLALAGGRSR